MKTITKLVILSIIAVYAIGLFSQNAVSDPAIPHLKMWIEPNPLVVGQTCPATVDVELIFENNSGSEITVDWTSDSLVISQQCATDWNPKTGTTPAIAANGGIYIDTITLNFPGECSGKSKFEFSGEIVGNTSDYDVETFTVICNEKVPSLSAWGAAILVALLLISGLYIIRRRKVTA